MNRVLFLYFLILFFPIETYAQTWQWEKMLKPYNSGKGGFESAVILSNLAVDKAGNTYVLLADSSVFFNGKNLVSIGDPGLFKISSNGDAIWTAHIHFSNSQLSVSNTEIEGGMLNNIGVISIAPNGHIIVCDHMPGTLGFDSITLAASGGLTNSHTAHTTLFLAECDTSGNWVQAHSIGATISNYTYLTGMSIDGNSNVIVSGTSFGTLVIEDAKHHVWLDDSVYSSPAIVFLGSFKMDGEVNWVDDFVNRYGTDLSNKYDMDMDPEGNLYFAASYSIPSNYDTVFIYKIRANGNLASIKVIPDMYGGSSGIAYTVKTDKSSNIYFASTLTGSIDFGSGYVWKKNNLNGFLAKYDSNFAVQWVQSLNSTGTSGFDNMSLDNSSNIYAVGNFSGQLHLGDSVYTGSAFISEYSPNGKIIMGNIVPGYWNNIALDSMDNLIIDGNFSGTVHFDCDSLIGSVGYNYIAKFNPHPPSFKIIPFCTGDSLICVSDSLQFHNCSWKFSDGTILSGRKVAYTNSHVGYYHFTLYASNAVSCSVFISDSFKHPAPPIAAFTTKDSVACEYTKVILNDISKTDTLASGTWPQDIWDFGDGTSSKSNKTTTKIYQDTGSFTIKLSYNNGFCAVDTSMKINVIPAPKPGFNVSDSNGCQPLAVQISNATSKLVTGYYYDFGNGIHDTIQSPKLTYTQSGNYKILQELKGPSGCITKDSAFIHVRRVYSNKDTANVANVSVGGGSQNIAVQWDTISGASVYDLYRYTDYDSTNAKLILQTQYNLYFDSNNVDPDAHSYTYSLQAEDSCGNVTSRGRVGRTMRLTGYFDENLNPVLNWNPYLGWPHGAEDHSILRKKADSSFEMVGYSHGTTFTDFSFNKDPIYGECYVILAFANHYPFTSYSNVFCFGNRPQIFVPDIFTPNSDSLNDIFTPVFTGIKSWSMEIFNRWGGKVYSLSEPSNKQGKIGWDGNWGGQPAPFGVYAYYIEAKDYSGNTIVKKGTLILAR